MRDVISTLRGMHILRAIELADRVRNLDPQMSPPQLNDLRLLAIRVESDLRIHSGIEDMRVSVQRDAE
jgi:hypothetical protein